MPDSSRNGDDLRAWPLFSSLTEESAARFAHLCVPHSYAAGELIYGRGVTAEFLYLIQRGRVKVVRESAEGREMIVAFHGRGDHVGCCCVLENSSLPCSAQATEATQAIRISRTELLGIMRDNPEVAIKALQMATERLRAAHTRMMTLSLDPAQTRVVAVLLELHDRFGAKVNGGPASLIKCRVTRLEIAEMAGVTLETASRTMSSLRRAGHVGSSHEGIVLLDPDVLTQYGAPQR